MTRMRSLLTGAATLVAFSLGLGIDALQVQAASAVRVPAGLPAAATLLLRYDADHDGVVTRAELDAGLKADFAEADSNHDGCLDPAEVRVENERRLAQDGTQASPLKDWNLDGCVDMREFGNTAHSYFDLADRSKDGRVTMAELRGPSMPIPPPTVEKRTPAKAPTQTSASSSSSPTSSNPSSQRR